MEDKFAPWATPVVDAIKERIGKAPYDIALKNGDIEMVPFEVMRGRSWKNAFVLLDEAQNTTLAEIKTFLTRVGEDCTMVINGDVSQCDLAEASGLRTVIDLIRSHSLPIPVIEFTLADIVRSGLCAMWVRAFEAAHL
jgi:phosphate starvation-inducible PhoH-like protein